MIEFSPSQTRALSLHLSNNEKLVLRSEQSRSHCFTFPQRASSLANFLPILRVWTVLPIAHWNKNEIKKVIMTLNSLSFLFIRTIQPCWSILSETQYTLVAYIITSCYCIPSTGVFSHLCLKSWSNKCSFLTWLHVLIPWYFKGWKKVPWGLEMSVFILLHIKD